MCMWKLGGVSCSACVFVLICSHKGGFNFFLPLILSSVLFRFLCVLWFMRGGSWGGEERERKGLDQNHGEQLVLERGVERSGEERGGAWRSMVRTLVGG